MDTNYECPRCGYKINRKSSMRSHLFGRMVTCPAIVRDIILTDNMKNYILENHKWHAPEKPNITNYNTINIFISTLSIPTKLENWSKLSNQRILTLQDSVARGLSNAGYDKDHLESIWANTECQCNLITLNDRKYMMTEMMNPQVGFMQSIAYEAKSNNIYMKDDENWIGLDEKAGMKRIIEEYQEKYFNEYEVYTIHKWFFHQSPHERTNARTRLLDHYKFIRAFDCKRYDISTDIRLNTREDIIDKVNTLWESIDDQVKHIENKRMYDSFKQIVKHVSSTLSRELNNEIRKYLAQNENYKPFIEALGF